MSNYTVIVTSGGTREKIDSVRVLTNISSGKLGAKTTDELLREGYNVHYVYSAGTVLPHQWNIEDYQDQLHLHRADTVAELVETFERLVPRADAIIHAMAVSDFTFRHDREVKLKSNSKEAFIEYLAETIEYNPKVASLVKGWNPRIKLMTFKFEVGLTHDTLLAVANTSGMSHQADAVLANDLVEMREARSHIGYLFTPTRVGPVSATRLVGKDDIARGICARVNDWSNQ